VTLSQDQSAQSSCEECEHTRGRLERRFVEVYVVPETLRGDWPGFATVVRVVRSGWRKDKGTNGGKGRHYERESLYITSLSDSATVLAEVVRQHWHVENRLHWCKDVVQGEDGGRTRSMAGAWVQSALRSAALSVQRYAGEWSPTEARSRLANRVDLLLNMIRT
jgi:predicted transposase YbfD/YdcC